MNQYDKAIVRKASLEDLPVLQNFMLGLIEAEIPMDATIKEDTINYYDLSTMIKDSESEVLVAVLDGEIVASGSSKIKKDLVYLKHKKQGYLGFMFVPEQHRGNGLNKLILQALLDWCKERNVFEIKLDVYAVNSAAISAYEKAGFKKHLVNMRLNIED
jgi:RimJ/RimL family protein N-acetyltransferase